VADWLRQMKLTTRTASGSRRRHCDWLWLATTIANSNDHDNNIGPTTTATTTATATAYNDNYKMMTIRTACDDAVCVDNGTRLQLQQQQQLTEPELHPETQFQLRMILSRSGRLQGRLRDPGNAENSPKQPTN